MSRNTKNMSAQQIAKVRQIKMIGVYSIFIITVAVIAILACIFVFFKVEKITVSDMSLYTETEIIEASGIKQGENLAFLNTESAEKNLELKFTYLENVEVKKKVPNKVEITGTVAETYYSFAYNNEYLYVSKYGKALEFGSVPYEGSLIVDGVEIAIADGRIEFSEKAKEDIFNQIADVFTEDDDIKLSKVDLSNLYNVTVIYDNRISIELGEASDIDYKLNFGLEIMNNIGENEHGTLDLSLSKNANKAYFMPEDMSQSEEFTDESQDEGSIDGSSTDEGDKNEPEDTGGESSDGDSSSDGEDDNEEVKVPSSQRGDDIPDF